jgi:hypothetical protein
MPLWLSMQIVSVDDHPMERLRVRRDRLQRQFKGKEVGASSPSMTYTHGSSKKT